MPLKLPAYLARRMDATEHQTLRRLAKQYDAGRWAERIQRAYATR